MYKSRHGAEIRKSGGTGEEKKALFRINQEGPTKEVVFKLNPQDEKEIAMNRAS